jgi:hypothetical protein
MKVREFEKVNQNLKNYRNEAHLERSLKDPKFFGNCLKTRPKSMDFKFFG